MENDDKLRNRRKRKKFVVAITIVLVAIAIGGGMYLGDYYNADSDEIEKFVAASDIEYRRMDDGTIVWQPEEATKGLIFYPGGKVEYTAYIPLLQACAEQGVMCILTEMPFNLAVFDINAADGIQEEYPEIEEWYIGGHSLGGSMAAYYLADHVDDYKGLILLGSYSTADLSKTDLGVLSIYGSEDNVMNREKYDKNKDNLPDNLVEYVIEGGCHAYFGMYGEQDGDGTANISCPEQIEETAEAICKFVMVHGRADSEE